MRIGHRCACQHGDLSHRTNGSGKRECACQPCTKRCRRSDVAELLPTFDVRGRTVERVVRPGDPLSTEGDSGGPRTCDCDACQALYAELTSTELEPANA